MLNWLTTNKEEPEESQEANIKHLRKYHNIVTRNDKCESISKGDYVELKAKSFLSNYYAGIFSNNVKGQYQYAYVLDIDKSLDQMDWVHVKLGGLNDMRIAFVYDRGTKVFIQICDCRLFVKADPLVARKCNPTIAKFVDDTPVTDVVPGMLVRPRAYFEIDQLTPPPGAHIPETGKFNNPLLVMAINGEKVLLAGAIDEIIEETEASAEVLCQY